MPSLSLSGPGGGGLALPSGITPPDFSRNNQFSGAPLPQMGMGQPGGNPFSLTPGASQAASSLFPQSSPAGGGLGVGGAALNNAANKLSSAADKLMAAADKLNSMNPGGPNQSPGSPLPTSSAPGVPGPSQPSAPGRQTRPGGSPAAMFNIGSLAQQAVNIGTQFAAAGFNYNTGIQSISEGQQGIGNQFRSLESARRQNRYSMAGGLGGFGIGAAGALGLSMMIPGVNLAVGAGIALTGAGLGATALGEKGRQAGYNDPISMRRDRELAQAQFNISSAGNMSPAGLLSLNASRQRLTDANGDIIQANINIAERYNRAAGAVGFNEGFAGAAVARQTAQMNLAPFTEGNMRGINTSVLRRRMGMSRREAAQVMGQVGNIAGTSLMEQDVTNVAAAFNTFGQSGIGAYAASMGAATIMGGDLVGTGYNGMTLLQQANASGLKGQAAANYVASGISYFGGRAAAGMGNTPESTAAFESFVQSGRRKGLAGFSGSRAFERGQNVTAVASGLGKGLLDQLGITGMAQQIGQAALLNEAGGDLNKVMNIAETRGGQVLEGAFKGMQLSTAMMRSLGVDASSTENIEGGLGTGTMSRRALGVGGDVGGARAGAARREDVQASSFNQKIFEAVTSAIGSLAGELGDGKTLNDVVEAIKNIGTITTATSKSIGKEPLKPSPIEGPPQLPSQSAQSKAFASGMERQRR